MSITVKTIRVSVDGVKSSGFDIVLDGAMFRMDNFALKQSLMAPNELTFTLHKDPEERFNETVFSVCGQIIGKEITMELDTESMEAASWQSDKEVTGEVKFRGVIASATGNRNSSEFEVVVTAYSWDALLVDNPSCLSFEDKKLDDIVQQVISDYSDKIDGKVESRYTEQIPYCVQYNETNYQFLQRMATRYGEWMYNDGEHLVFGKLNVGDPVRLHYPSQDVPAFRVDMRMQHVAFAHVASSYHAYDSTRKEGLEEMQREYNTLADSVFAASQTNLTKPTLQNLHMGGYHEEDGREKILTVSTKTQARGQKANMLTYTGTTYCTKVKIGNTLIIADSYITDKSTGKKSGVDQDEILITAVTHRFSSDETYSNDFTGIPVACDYPPYTNSDVYPVAPSCRAKVIDNEDPSGLGRIRVQFDWQAKLSDAMITPWLRIAQPYAGGEKGFSFIPEKDEEVMVDFEGGNAERPYVKGMFYNGQGTPDAAWLVDGNTKNKIKAIRTRNGHTIEIHDEGDDGFIRIYDNKKENYVLTFSTDEKLIKLESTGNIELSAKKDIILHAEHDVNIKADNDLILEAKHDMQRTAEHDITERAGNDRTTTVTHNDDLTVKENQTITIESNKDEKVTSKLQVTAKDIRIEAQDKLLEYSVTHQAKASDSMALNASTRMDIKAAIVKVN